ncbi:hypothetical protein [Aliiruegeria haliotis]|uniref:hypothetical protein n=1 Tax=Aliiruegeria haliotis TaxID=1280846 RepID=UPI000D064F22|nr:hypothetical protein [Aliiruegeria haliotis]
MLSVVLQSIFPVRGLAYEAGELLEICSTSGIVEIRVDADGNEIAGDDVPCFDCRDCPLCMIVTGFSLSGEAGWDTHMVREPQKRGPECDTHTRNPARFWADNRGPPARNKKAIDLAEILFVEPTRVEGRAT